jgi:1-acyl-sn-glycerol-3-phosphate acyltransferase
MKQGLIGKMKMVGVSSLAWLCGMSVFVLLGSLLLAVGRFVDPKHYDGAVKGACRLILRCTFIRVQVRGREHLQPGRTYLFVGNHVNIFDVFVYYGYIPGRFRGVELDDHFRWFFYGRLIRRLGMIPISQTNGRSALKSLKLARQVLEQGTSVLILPEGGRTPDGRLQPFKRGSFILARNARADIVPVAMAGAFEIYHKGGRFIRPGRMALRFGKPIAFDAVGDLDLEELENRVRGELLSLLALTNEPTTKIEARRP